MEGVRDSWLLSLQGAFEAGRLAALFDAPAVAELRRGLNEVEADVRSLRRRLDRIARAMEPDEWHH